MATPKKFYMKFGMILHPASQWSIDRLGYDNKGKVDGIYRTAWQAIAKKSHTLLSTCIGLCMEKIRWPKELNQDHVEGKEKGRWKRAMTRDPYIATNIAMYILDKGLKYPIFPTIIHYRRYLWAFLRYLRDEKVEDRVAFEDSVKFLLKWGKSTKWLHRMVRDTWANGLHKKTGLNGYSLYLWAWMAYIIDSQDIKEMLWHVVPRHNLLLLLMVCPNKYKSTTLYVNSLKRAQEYRAKDGFQWGADEWFDPKMPGDWHEYLDPNDQYKPDKDILEWFLKRHNLQKT